MKIIADANIPFVAEAFAELGEVNLVSGRDLTPGQVQDAEILLVRSVTRVDATLLEKSRVQFVGTATSGVDHVNRGYLAHRGISFASAPGSNARSVAEYVLSAVLVLLEQQGRRLADATAAVIGYGHVGSRVAHLLTAAGVRCLLNDPPLKDLTSEERFLDLDEVLSADIVTLHVPLTMTGRYPTYRLIDETALSRLRPDAILINTARGGVMDERDLLRRLDENPVMAVVDCWEGEPNINTDLLDKAALATPHIAGYSFDGKVLATEMLYAAACRYFGLPPAAWFPPAKLNGGSLSFLEEIEDEDILRRAVLSCYDVQEDSAALKRGLTMRLEKVGIYFDSLRRNYRKRREFPQWEVTLPAGGEKVALMLERIGFKVLQKEVS